MRKLTFFLFFSFLMISSANAQSPTGDEPGDPDLEVKQTKGVRLYPVPTNGRFYLELETPTKESSIMLLMNEYGRIVETRKGVFTTQSFDLTQQPKGNYVIVLVEAGKTVFTKIIFKN